MATLKYSRQREAIKDFLMTRKDHPTADVVYENIKKIYPNISLGTVYRNLSLLSEIGEIQKLSNFGGADLETEDLNSLAEKAAKNFPGKISDCDIRFFGICPKCVNK